MVPVRAPTGPIGGDLSHEFHILAETGESACVPGAIIPVLTLQVPGSAPAAVLMAAMLIHGVKPGPMIMIESPQFVYDVVAMMLLATIGLCVVVTLLLGIVPGILFNVYLGNTLATTHGLVGLRMRALSSAILFLILIVIPWALPQFRILDWVLLPPVEWLSRHYLSVTAWVIRA